MSVRVSVSLQVGGRFDSVLRWLGLLTLPPDVTLSRRWPLPARMLVANGTRHELNFSFNVTYIAIVTTAYVIMHMHAQKFCPYRSVPLLA